ncbi:MAG: phenylalanine--tRNA ligase subunit alpha [Bacteroidia bacterium]|nr:phenylalanine--tRNA ligase subunit alpha [Bacteroidia bacterium]
MLDKIKKILHEVENFRSTDIEEIEQFRIRMLGRKGVIGEFFSEFKAVPGELKKEYGAWLNELKEKATDKILALRSALESKDNSQTVSDLSLPGETVYLGSRHPISVIQEEIIGIFSRIGYTVEVGPEIEDDWHNFSALNFPVDHPARDMQDTFFIKKNPDIMLRTHTSSVQIRVMQSHKPPIRSIFPGRVFRNEAISARSHCIFHQVEGLYIDKNVSFADLKQTLLYFSKEMFGEDTQIRLRPSYFPFTEPSAELDVSCNLCGGKGCNLCKYTGWLEILGCGMVDPNVLENCGIDSKEYTGFAFGMGIERQALLKYGVKDIRLFFENDIRFLKQFRSVLSS